MSNTPDLVSFQHNSQLGASSELGSFVAGVVIRASPREVQGQRVVLSMLDAVEPVRDFFVAFFFAAAGMHLYPSFLVSNMWLLVMMTAATVMIKYAASMAVWLMVWRSPDVYNGHLISAGLVPMSEFVFVLASRAKRLEVISMPVYFLLLSLSAISLLINPAVWKLALKLAQRIKT